MFLGRQCLQLSGIEPHTAAAGTAADTHLMVDSFFEFACAFGTPHSAQVEDGLLQFLLAFRTELSEQLTILLREVDVFPSLFDIPPGFGIFVKFASSVHGPSFWALPGWTDQVA